jgi:hypothetical protein
MPLFIAGSGVALLAVGLTVLVKGRAGGALLTVIGLLAAAGGAVWEDRSTRTVPSPAPAPTPTAAVPVDWAAVLMSGETVILHLDDISPILGHPEFIEGQDYEISFAKEHCVWTMVGPAMLIVPRQVYVAKHRRVLDPFVEKPFISEEEIRTNPGGCTQPTSGQIVFYGIGLGFDPNGVVTMQVSNPALGGGGWGPMTVPKRFGTLRRKTA